jgi:hypothetical protein
MYRKRKTEKTDLEDPFVHDNNSDIKTPPLKNSKHRSKHTPLKNHTLLHFSASSFSQKKNQITANKKKNPEFTSIQSFPFSSLFK